MAKRKNPGAVALGKRSGKARMKKLTPEKRSQVARQAAAARWETGRQGTASYEVKINQEEQGHIITADSAEQALSEAIQWAKQQGWPEERGTLTLSVVSIADHAKKGK
jgi:hypothetical protein